MTTTNNGLYYDPYDFEIDTSYADVDASAAQLAAFLNDA